MVTEERPEEEQEITGLEAVPSQELAPVEITEPLMPKGLSEQESAQLKTKALALVQELGEARRKPRAGAERQHHPFGGSGPESCRY